MGELIAHSGDQLRNCDGDEQKQAAHDDKRVGVEPCKLKERPTRPPDEHCRDDAPHGADAAGDAESELRHPAAEGDPRFLRREPAVEEVAGHRLAAEWIGAPRGRAFLCGGRVVGEEIDRVWRGEPFGDRLAVSGFLGSAAQGPGREEQADQDRQAGGGGTGGFQ